MQRGGIPVIGILFMELLMTLLEEEWITLSAKNALMKNLKEGEKKKEKKK